MLQKKKLKLSHYVAVYLRARIFMRDRRIECSELIYLNDRV